MKIALIGSTGYLGRALELSLREQNHLVWAYGVGSGTSILKYTVGTPDFHKNIAQLMDFRPEVLINLAWVSGTLNYQHHPANYIFNEFAAHLMKLCGEISVKSFISLGSSAEYGENPGVCHESLTPLRGNSLYAVTKRQTYYQLSQFAEDQSYCFAWVRPFQVFGPNMPGHKLIARLLSAKTKGGSVFLKFPNSYLDWIHVSDVVTGICYIMDTKLQGPLNLGTGLAISNNEVKALFSLKDYTSKVESNLQASLSVSSFDSRLMGAGWKPRISLEKYVREALDSI